MAKGEENFKRQVVRARAIVYMTAVHDVSPGHFRDISTEELVKKCQQRSRKWHSVALKNAPTEYKFGVDFPVTEFQVALEILVTQNIATVKSLKMLKGKKEEGEVIAYAKEVAKPII